MLPPWPEQLPLLQQLPTIGWPCTLRLCSSSAISFSLRSSSLAQSVSALIDSDVFEYAVRSECRILLRECSLTTLSLRPQVRLLKYVQNNHTHAKHTAPGCVLDMITASREKRQTMQSVSHVCQGAPQILVAVPARGQEDTEQAPTARLREAHTSNSTEHVHKHVATTHMSVTYRTAYNPSQGCHQCSRH